MITCAHDHIEHDAPDDDEDDLEFVEIGGDYILTQNSVNKHLMGHPFDSDAAAAGIRASAKEYAEHAVKLEKVADIVEDYCAVLNCCFHGGFCTDLHCDYPGEDHFRAGVLAGEEARELITAIFADTRELHMPGCRTKTLAREKREAKRAAKLAKDQGMTQP